MSEMVSKSQKAASPPNAASAQRPPATYGVQAPPEAKTVLWQVDWSALEQPPHVPSRQSVAQVSASLQAVVRNGARHLATPVAPKN